MIKKHIYLCGLFAVIATFTVSCGQTHSTEIIGPAQNPVAKQSTEPTSDDSATPTPNPTQPVDSSSPQVTVPAEASIPASSPTPASGAAEHAGTTSIAPPTQTIVIETPPPPPPANLFVVIAGNGSCDPKARSKRFPGMWRTPLSDEFIENIMNRGLVGPNDNVLFVCYENFSPDMYFYDLKGSLQMEWVHEAKLDEVVLSRAAALNLNRLVILGYSYGGWRAMKLAASPLLHATLPTEFTFVSIDPISKVTCEGLFDSGCHQPPLDFTPPEWNALAVRTNWLNIFQTTAPFLSSGAIAAAHHNICVGHTFHIDMDESPTVWNTILSFLVKNLVLPPVSGPAPVAPVIGSY